MKGRVRRTRPVPAKFCLVHGFVCVLRRRQRPVHIRVIVLIEPVAPRRPKLWLVDAVRRLSKIPSPVARLHRAYI